jgi:hypothetical protein
MLVMMMMMMMRYGNQEHVLLIMITKTNIKIVVVVNADVLSLLSCCYLSKEFSPEEEEQRLERGGRHTKRERESV